MSLVVGWGGGGVCKTDSVKRLDPRLHLWICVFRFVPEGQGGGDYIFLLGLINCKLSI